MKRLGPLDPFGPFFHLVLAEMLLGNSIGNGPLKGPDGSGSTTVTRAPGRDQETRTPACGPVVPAQLQP
jgi:hypothetical protein